MQAITNTAMNANPPPRTRQIREAPDAAETDGGAGWRWRENPNPDDQRWPAQSRSQGFRLLAVIGSWEDGDCARGKTGAALRLRPAEHDQPTGFR